MRSSRADDGIAGDLPDFHASAFGVVQPAKRPPWAVRARVEFRRVGVPEGSLSRDPDALYT